MPPPDLSLVLAQMAIAGLGVTCLRALARVCDGLDNASDYRTRNSAAQIAFAFRSLFNLPETMALIRGMNGEEPYWRRVLEYCVDGGLQAMLDEYVHMLRESLGLFRLEASRKAYELAEATIQALTLRTPSLGVDEVIPDEVRGSVTLQRQRMRARFSLRFGEEETEDGKTVTRADQVRTAFNSPFWPFVLATTSVGQEGLDFHPYCHAVVHWNLPANPVDLEQREGRVHRYKGHAVRKNLALRYGGTVLGQEVTDPWEALFRAGVEGRGAEDSDLVPYWVYSLDNGAKIERHVPAFPLSRDSERLEALRRSLAVYRMVFGQPRQEDLIAYLLRCLPESEVPAVARQLRIDLSSPKRDVRQ